MPIKSHEEVQLEIVALKDLLPQLPDSKRGINAAIRVLEDNLGNDSVFDIFEGSDSFDDAHAALLWRDGMTNADPLSVQFREMLL